MLVVLFFRLLFSFAFGFLVFILFHLFLVLFPQVLIRAIIRMIEVRFIFQGSISLLAFSFFFPLIFCSPRIQKVIILHRHYHSTTGIIRKNYTQTPTACLLAVLFRIQMRHISVATVSQYFLQEADTRRALFINRRFTHFLLDVNLTRSFRFTDGTWRDYKKQTNKQTEEISTETKH